MCSVEEEAVAEVDVGEKGPRCWELQTQAMGLRPDWEHSKESKKKAFLKRLFYKGHFGTFVSLLSNASMHTTDTSPVHGQICLCLAKCKLRLERNGSTYRQ